MLDIRTPFIFIRHPESLGQTLTQNERADLCISHPEYPITDTGKEQLRVAFRYVGREFNPVQLRAFFHSTERRSREAMVLGMRQLSIPNSDALRYEDSRLDEKSEGIFRELRDEEVDLYYPGQCRIRERMGFYHFRPINGENCPDVELRIRSFAAEHLRDPLEGSKGYKVIVGHTKWFRILQRLIHDVSVEEYHLIREPVDNCSITVYHPSDCRRGIAAIPTPIVPWKGVLAATSGAV